MKKNYITVFLSLFMWNKIYILFILVILASE